MKLVSSGSVNVSDSRTAFSEKSPDAETAKLLSERGAVFLQPNHIFVVRRGKVLSRRGRR
jgi:hypothetical protein